MRVCTTLEDVRDARIAAENDMLLMRVAPGWMHAHTRGDVELEYLHRFFPHTRCVHVPFERSTSIAYHYGVCGLPMFIFVLPDGTRVDDGTLYPTKSTGGMKGLLTRARRALQKLAE